MNFLSEEGLLVGDLNSFKSDRFSDFGDSAVVLSPVVTLSRFSGQVQIDAKINDIENIAMFPFRETGIWR